MRFDLLIKGGEVVDPGSGLGGPLDLAVARGRVAAVDRDIPAEAAARVVDATGQHLTPGLVDLHTHVYHGATFWGIDPDPVAWRSGATTWVDAGSAGAYGLRGLLDGVAARARVRVLAFVYIAAVGLVAETGESADLRTCDPDLCARVAQAHGDRVVGVKVRMDRHAVGGNGLEPLRLALRAARDCGRPLMTHIGRSPPPVDQVLSALRPGDLLTHCTTGQSMRLVDRSGRVLPAVERAREAGVLLDVGHGAASFSFEVAEALLAAGVEPDVISSDAHQRSLLGPMFDLPTCLSKYLCLGMSLPAVIRAATTRPAQVAGRYPELGSLRPGARADLALFRLERGSFEFHDVHLASRQGTVRLRNTLTLVDGRPLPSLPPVPPAPWIERSPAQDGIERAVRPAAGPGPDQVRAPRRRPG